MRLVRTTAALAAAIIIGQTASAQPHPGRTNPDWLRVPTADELGAVWPVAALKKGLGGKVVLRCEVDLEGLAQECSVQSEDPPAMGFGSAALVLTPKFLFRPATQDGKPVTAWVTIPVQFGDGPTKGPAPPRLGTRIPGNDEPLGDRFYLLNTAPWDRAPTGAQLAAAYPRQAKPGTVGHVVLACHFSKTGDLKSCDTDVETPGGQGFASAAKSLIPLFHVDPAAAQGADLTKFHINLAIHFSAPGADKARLIDQPDWISTGAPSIDVFPERASKAGLKTGRAVLNCVADAQGQMTACQVVSEDPAGMDFGPAALKTAASIRLNRWGSNGQPADGARVVFAVRVNKDEPEAAPPKP